MTKQEVCATAIEAQITKGGLFTNVDIRNAVEKAGHVITKPKSFNSIICSELRRRIEAGAVRRIDKGLYEVVTGEPQTDPVTEWLAALDDLEDGEIPIPPLDELSYWLRQGGELDETQSLALLDVIAAQRQRLSNAEEEIAELRGALEPFAAYANVLDAASTPGHPIIERASALGALVSFINQGEAQIYHRDLRRAQVVLNGRA